LAKFLNHLQDKRLNIEVTADDVLENLGFATFSRDVLQGSFGGRLVVMIVNGDRGAGLGQSQADGVSDAAIPSGDTSRFHLQYHSVYVLSFITSF